MNENFISPNNLSKFADVIFAENLSVEDFKIINDKNLVVVHETKNPAYKSITYKVKSFNLKENDLIYCHTDFIDELFSLLRNIKELKNIKLITHQSDEALTKSQIYKKPECISKWYALNLDENLDNIEPIPFGLSNKMSMKNLTFVNEIPIKLNLNNKEDLLYVNFQKNTNRKERDFLYEYFAKYDWAKTKDPKLSLDEYKEDLSKYSFVLCPWGNGVDTHRIWESLYLGSIAITKRHPTFEHFSDLPILLVDSYEDITIDLLIDYKEKIKDKRLKYEKLNVSWWINSIKDTEEKKDLEVLKIKQNNIISKAYLIKSKLKMFLFSKYKKITYFFYRLKKIPKRLKLIK